MNRNARPLSRRVALLAAAALVASIAIAQDGSPRLPPCDAKTTESAKYCEKADHVVDKDGVDKEKKCKEHGDPVKKIDLCVKKHHVCAGEGGKSCDADLPEAGKCKCDKKTKEALDRCKVIYICKGCESRAFVKDELPHAEDVHKDPMKKKELRKTCEKSGQFPHTTVVK